MTAEQQNEIYRGALRDIAAVLDRARTLLVGARDAVPPPQAPQPPQAKPPTREQPPKSNALDGITMPFGKHKGERVDSIDGEYLKWLWDKGDLYGDLAEAVKKTLERAGVDLA